MRIHPLFVLMLLVAQSMIGAPLGHDAYWMEFPARDAATAVAEVRRYALAAEYHSEDRQVTGRGERLALFQRGKLSIDVFQREGVCHIVVAHDGYSSHRAAVAERRRLYSALLSHGIRPRIEHGRELVETLDYSR